MIALLFFIIIAAAVIGFANMTFSVLGGMIGLVLILSIFIIRRRKQK